MHAEKDAVIESTVKCIDFRVGYTTYSRAFRNVEARPVAIVANLRCVLTLRTLDSLQL